MFRWIAFLLAVCPLAAVEYAVTVNVASDTANVVTIQQPATSARNVQGKAVSVFCGVAGDIEVERDGTAATSTAATIVGIDRNTPAPAFKAWSASDVGNGSTLALYRCTANQTIAIDTSSMFLNGNGTGKNWTIRVTLDSAGRSIVNIQVDEN